MPPTDKLELYIASLPILHSALASGLQKLNETVLVFVGEARRWVTTGLQITMCECDIDKFSVSLSVAKVPMLFRIMIKQII